MPAKKPEVSVELRDRDTFVEVLIIVERSSHADDLLKLTGTTCVAQQLSGLPSKNTNTYAVHLRTKRGRSRSRRSVI